MTLVEGGWKAGCIGLSIEWEVSKTGSKRKKRDGGGRERMEL